MIALLMQRNSELHVVLFSDVLSLSRIINLRLYKLGIKYKF